MVSFLSLARPDGQEDAEVHAASIVGHMHGKRYGEKTWNLKLMLSQYCVRTRLHF